jgi:ribonuclease VapC
MVRRAVWLVIDTSALVALLEDESEAPVLRQALSGDATRLISTVSLLEATCVLGARRGPGAVLELSLFLSEFDLRPVAFDPEQLSIAQRAWLVYGRGRHPAKLNFGDCASYALAQSRSEPLLFIGNDFSQTDILIAGR